MEESKKIQLKVGIFVGIGLVALMFSIVMLGGDQSFFKSTFRISTHLRDVQGLAQGSIVSLGGLTVGNVRSLEFQPGEKLIRVSMDIDERHQYRITASSLAEVRTQGALGDKYIYIMPGAFDEAPLKDGDTLKADNSAGFLDVISEKSKDLGVFVDLLKETHALVAALNGNGKAARLMDNLDQSSQDFKVVMAEARALMKDIRGSNESDNQVKNSLARLSNILEKIDRGQGSLGALINDRALHDKLMSLVGGSPRSQFLKPLVRDSIKTSEK